MTAAGPRLGGRKKMPFPPQRPVAGGEGGARTSGQSPTRAAAVGRLRARMMGAKGAAKRPGPTKS